MEEKDEKKSGETAPGGFENPSDTEGITSNPETVETAGSNEQKTLENEAVKTGRAGKNKKKKNSTKEENTDELEIVEKKKGGKVVKIIVWILILALIGLAIFRIVQSRDTEGEIEERTLTNVTVQEVQYGTVEITSPLSGRIEPKDEVSIIPMMSGEVKSLNVSKGDYVSKGSTLFTVDTTQAQLALEQAKAAYNVAANAVDGAKTNYERMKMLYDEGAIAKAEYDGAETQYNSAVLSLAQAQVAIDQANEAFTNAVVTAPISGYVTSVNIVQGALATQASPAVTISDTSSLKINTTVSEYLISRVKEGDKVDVYIKSLSEEPYKGTITTLIPTPATGTLTYPITVTLDKTASDVMSGMFAEIKIVSDKRAGVITVPSEAIIIKNGISTAVVLEEGLPVYREVQVGLDNGTEAEIISGLNKGDQLIIKGQNYVLEGEEVNIINQDQTASGNTDDHSAGDAE